MLLNKMPHIDPMDELADQLAGQRRLMRRPEVKRILGVPDSTLYGWMAKGLLKRPRKIGPRAVAWTTSEIADFLRSRKAI